MVSVVNTSNWNSSLQFVTLRVEIRFRVFLLSEINFVLIVEHLYVICVKVQPSNLRNYLCRNLQCSLDYRPSLVNRILNCHSATFHSSSVWIWLHCFVNGLSSHEVCFAVILLNRSTSAVSKVLIKFMVFWIHHINL